MNRRGRFFGKVALCVTGFSTLLLGNGEACSVCFSAKEETIAAFVGTTIFLSLLPLGMIFGIVYWFRKHGEKV